MRRIVVWALSLVLLGAVAAYAGDEWLERQPKLYQLSDHAATDRALQEIGRHYSTFAERMRAIALLRVGTPYRLGCLGEEKGRDTAPLFRTDVADCTVLVLTNTAMAHALNWEGARAMMQHLNYYEGGGVSYENRIHFTCDRLLVSRYFKDVTESVAGPGQARTVTLTLNRKADGSKLLQVPFQKKVTMRYVPATAVTKDMLARLPAAAGVAFVRLKNIPKGLLVGHEGLVIDKRFLVHADSVNGHVRKVELVDYLRRNRDYFDGAIFYQIL